MSVCAPMSPTALTDKISILSVKAVGDIGAPTLISYDLISEKGEIYHNTVMGSTDTGWTSGGTELANTIKSITTQLGDVSKLRTRAKANLVNAINELKAELDGEGSNLSELDEDYKEFKRHDHDERYLAKSGDTVTGHLNIVNERYLQGVRSNGSHARLLGVNSTNKVILGDSALQLEVVGSSITFNDKKIWHENNDGSGSGLDADLLGGSSHRMYIRRDADARFDKNIIASANIFSKEGIIFGDYSPDQKGAIKYDSSGAIRLYNKHDNNFTITGSGVIESKNYHIMNASGSEVGLRFRLNGNEGGIGFYRNNNSKFLGIWDWQRKKRVGYISHTDGSFNFDEPIVVGGRKLFMQSGTPTGSIPTGSLWIS